MPPLLQLRDIVADASAARRCWTARNCRFLRATASRSSGATARANRRCSASRRGRQRRTAERASRSRRRASAYLPQEPDVSGFATTLDYVLAGLGEDDDPLCGARDDGRARARPRGRSRAPFRRRSAARGAGQGVEPRTRHLAARRADKSSRPDRDRMAGKASRSNVGPRLRSSATINACSPT